MPVHHLMVGTWTPPGAIFTFAFDDEALTLKLVKRTEIARDEPISWMTFDVRQAKLNSKKRIIANFIFMITNASFSMRKKPSTAQP
jgi:carboxy-cis,cis-muconate cyclase